MNQDHKLKKDKTTTGVMSVNVLAHSCLGEMATPKLTES